MSRVCQLKYAMSYVRKPLSFKSKCRIELLIYNPFETMIPQSPQFHKSLLLAVRDDTVVVFFTLQTIEKVKCIVGVQLARSIINGLVHEFEVELVLFSQFVMLLG